jgi:hypothetical protein
MGEVEEPSYQHRFHVASPGDRLLDGIQVVLSVVHEGVFWPQLNSLPLLLHGGD